jgi:putative CocE/NonD family hydrolase
MQQRALWFLAMLVGASEVPARAQAPDAGKYSKEQFEVRASRGNRVRMRDGVQLSVDIFQPAAQGRYPGILVHTPYNNNSPAWTTRAKWFARRGYVVALSDTRGRFDSDGNWDPFHKKHKSDGYDLVEWIAKQRWCTGKVGMMGQSYMGWTQWWTATQAPPSLKAIVPEVAPPDAFYNAPYQNGVLVGWAMDWAAMMAGRTTQTVADGPYGGFANTRAKDLLRTPYIKLNEFRGALDSPWFAKWIQNNVATAEYWKGISYQGKENYARITVPSLNVTGWFDANQPGAPMNYQGVKKFGRTPQARRPSLIIGPWPHSFNRSSKVGKFDYGKGAVIDWDGYVCRWLDHYLKGSQNGVTKDAPVYVFVMGRNRWFAEKDWPLPQTRWTKYFLHSAGKANSLKGDGLLNTTAPGDEPPDNYTYNPDKPTPSPFRGGHLEEGAVDTRKPAGREDVLVYTSGPLQTDLEVTGPIATKLYAATSARDTDWMVRLIDVYPDGYAALLCDGLIRARNRDAKSGGAFNPHQLSQIEPGKVTEYTLSFWRATSNLFRKGHRLRVEISSSYYPYYLRNLNTGADNIGLETRSVVARQKVFHNKEYSSHIVLPVIPAR